jgi:hypothetical protein
MATYRLIDQLSISDYPLQMQLATSAQFQRHQTTMLMQTNQ